MSSDSASIGINFPSPFFTKQQPFGRPCVDQTKFSHSAGENREYYAYYAVLPNTSARHYVGRFEDPHDERILVDPGTVLLSQSGVPKENYYDPLKTTPPPTRSNSFTLEGKTFSVIPNVLTTIPEQPGWTTSNRKRAKKVFARHTRSTPFDFNELNTAIELCDKQARTSMRAGKRRKQLQPHAGIFNSCSKLSKVADVVTENADFITEAASRLNSARDFLQYEGSSRDDLISNFMSRLEDLTAFIVGIQTTTSWKNFLALVHLYVRTFFPQSAVLRVMKWIIQAFKMPSETMSTQNGIEFSVPDSFPFSIDSLKSLIGNWKSFKTSDLAKNLANVVDILVTLGFLGANDSKTMNNPFRSTEFSKFSTRVWDIQAEAVDFTSMIFETVIFFLERGYAAFVNKDPTLLLYSDNETHMLDLEYSLLSSALPLLECGRLSELAERMNASRVPGSVPIVDAADFDNRVDKMVSRISYLLKFEKHPGARVQLSSRLTAMTKLRTALILQQRTSPIREKPFCIEIFGGSSVAKTTLCNIFARVILHANGFASTKDHIVTCNDMDKYQSEYTSSKTAVILDDYGNTRADHYDVAPTKKIIDFCNNVNLAALNAEVEKKGNVMIRPKMVLLTTNVKGLMAHHFSNEPVSIQRRFEVIITATLKPDYVDPITGGPLKEKMASQAIPDAWNLLLETVQIVRGINGDTANLVSIFTKESEGGNRVARTVDIFTALQTLKEMSKIHFSTQKTYVQSVENFFQIDLCKHSMPPDVCRDCKCVSHPLLEKKLCLHSKIPTECSICQSTFATLLNLHSGEEDAARNAAARAFLEGFDDDVSLAEFVEQSGKQTPLEIEIIPTFCDYFADRRVRIVAGIAAVTGIIGTIYVVYRVHKMFAKTAEIQGSVISQPIKLESDYVNPWKTVKSLELPTSLESKTITADQLSDVLKRVMGFALIRPAGTTEERKVCAIVPMKGDRWLFPWHMVMDENITYELEVRTTRAGELGRNFKQLISSQNYERVEQTDYVVVRLPNGGDNRNISKFLFEGKVNAGWGFTKMFARTVLRLQDGSIETQTMPIQSRQEVSTEMGSYEAYCYNYPRPTFPGQCMMALITESSTPGILGFHLAGSTGNAFGAAGVILRKWFNSADERLSARSPMKCHSSGTFRGTQFGVNFTPTSTINALHSTKQLVDNLENDQKPCLEIFGAHPQGTARFKSNVKQTPISEHVANIMKMPRVHGAPNPAKAGSHWVRDLQLISKPQGLFDPVILSKASSDLTEHVMDFMDSHPETVELIHPYDVDTILAGVDGVTSVDSVDLNTSMGWPINSPKKNFIKESTRSVPGISRPLDIDPTILAEVESIEETLKSGERYYAINRGTKKDEAVKFTKDKIRIFAGAQYVTIHNTRKYYLPLIRFMQTHWKHLECAVGINPYGPQWHELTEWMTIHGSERMIAGDFKNYDKTISPTLMTEAFGILIAMARKAGYAEDQITIMEGLATEICYPMYEWDGVFVQAFGSNPSGHPLTVIINNLANSLYMRYAYYAMHKNAVVPKFATRIRLMCYGDDNFQNVHPEETLYNFTTVQAELAAIGIIFTPADKDLSKVDVLIPLKEVSFLKRGFVYNSDLQLWMAPLEEESISKSLHNYLDKKGSRTLPAQIAGQAIGFALREFFRFPRDIFELRREQLLAVAKISDVEKFIPDFPTYDSLKDELLNGVELGPPLPEFWDLA